jgi:UDP-4-amino-4,6-dideoxy-N-acetyl-beta-L-altrosamine transaminase
VIPYGKQNITDEDIDGVINALRSDYLTQGPRIKEFEEAFAKYVRARYAVAVSNGTAALHLAAIALSVEPGCNVITSPITFVASANCIKYCGGNVYFADINPSTFTLDIRAVEELIKSKPAGFFKGIIPVDLAGYPVNLAEFRKLADEHGLWIIEDACHAPGGFVVDEKGDRQYCGNGKYANASIFSFHPVKHITCGEGGMITTNDEKLYKKLILLRTHGITRDHDMLSENHGGWYYEMLELGYNYRLTDFQAALGMTQLAQAEKGLQRRREIAQKYASKFAGHKGILAQSDVLEGHAYHLYVIRTSRRKELYEYLREKNIYCQIHYIPVHLMPYYRQFGYKKGDFPNAEKYYAECLSLPMYPTLKDEEVEYVTDNILSFFDTNS